MANFITGIRIICSVLLLFCQSFSAPFYIIYIVSGLSDMIDGVVARMTGTVSEFGSKLDTIADFLLVIICSVKLFPVLVIGKWMYIWIMIIAIIKVINIIVGFVINKKIIAVHNILNKVTGVMVFAIPLLFYLIELRYVYLPICILATVAAIYEGYYIWARRLERIGN